MNEKIMIVDDEESIADLVEVYLQNEGYRVCKFYNATDALDCLKQEDLSLAILDVMLPDMDGFTLCRKIREKRRISGPLINVNLRERWFPVTSFAWRPESSGGRARWA